MKKNLALAITGFALIAVTYGMARFSWGIMLPDIRQAISFSPQTAGLIAACSYGACCLSVFFASFLTQRFGPRFPAVLAALTAAAGLLILALAPSPPVLAAGLFIAGLSSGLASPALAGAVSAGVNPERQTQVNTIINAGTSGGIILSVPVLFFVPGGWRVACAIFALLALASLIPVWRYLPRATRAAEEVPGWRALMQKPGMIRLSAIALVSGIASAAWWSFGPELLQRHTKLDDATTNVLWLVSGGAGVAAVFTGSLAKRIGMRGVYSGSQLFMAGSLIALALSKDFAWWLVPVVAMSGAGYVILSGVLLVQGARVAEPSPAAGVSIAFLMLALGQIIGSVFFGQLYGTAGAAWALLTFSALSLAMLAVAPDAEHQAS
ncbi:MFS transporter [Leclercia adecarboxylata]|uniref:MFS transporter n=1 Tax=Leclercia adecarboxylata TaxID=83655 RepID=UPI002DBFC6F5|nr:MFS transporter [Leclercia adecarboxylata]MEB6378675.1 MFS transporter [Leclercia adecarboxylata]